MNKKQNKIWRAVYDFMLPSIIECHGNGLDCWADNRGRVPILYFFLKKNSILLYKNYLHI